MNKARVASIRTPNANGRRRNGLSESLKNDANDGNGAVLRAVRALRGPRRDLESAIQPNADLYEFAPVGYVTLHRSGRIEQVNLAACELLRAKREYLIGAPFSLCVERNNLNLFLHHLVRCRAGDHRVETSLRLKRRTGEPVSVFLSSTATADVLYDGSYVYQTAIIDLTERERAEEALRAKEAELELIVTQTPFMLTRCTRNLRYRYVSNAYAKMLGRTPDEIAGRPMVEIMGKEALAAIQPFIDRVLSGKTACYEGLVPFRGGQRYFLHCVYVPDKNERGEVVGWFASLIDITARKRVEEAFRESEARMRALVEQATAGIARCDRRGRIIFANQRLAKMFGYQRSELIGKTIKEITHPDDVRHNMELFQRMIRDGKPFEAERRYVRKDGKVLWADISASPVRDEKGKVKYAVAVMVDVTTRKKAEALLKRSKRLLESLVEQRTKALRVANVELQGEIARRKGLEGQILEISDREQQRLGQELHDGLCQQLTAIGFLARSTALRLKDHRVVQVDELEKIAQLINSSVMDARNIARDLHKEEVEAAEFVPALQRLVDRRIWRRPCRLDLKTEINIEENKVASQLYRILREALVNANKHAHARKVVLEVRRSKKELVFSVADDGIGISTKTKPGPGLGFHIMKYRAESIGARLELESRKKGGTRLSIYLPVEKNETDVGY